MSSGFTTTTEVEFLIPGPGSHSPNVTTQPVAAIKEQETQEVLDFLSRRPIHTVCMAGYIRDNGVISPHNRGTFYGYRDQQDQLQGVALIGHATLIETQSDAALKAFAAQKHQFRNAHLVRGERHMISRFWKHFAEYGHVPRRACRELLFEQNAAPRLDQSVPELRRATLDDLESVIVVNAQMVMTECGVDRTRQDPAGFRERITRRIKQGRVWVWTQEDKLIFKADVFAQTPEMTYLEGINVHPDCRGKGVGLRCLIQLGQTLLQSSRSICLMVNEQRVELKSFYQRAGYVFRDTYDTIYLDT